MCTIIMKSHLIGKNFDSVVNVGMMFTNKRGLVKNAAVFPPDRPLEWVSSYGSISFSLSGKEMPACGVNEAGLVVEQATLPEGVYPKEQEGKPLAGILEATQFLLDTCSNVEQALIALEQFDVVKSSWPVHLALVDSCGNMAVVEFLQGRKVILRGTTETARLLTNTEYQHQEIQMECTSAEEMFSRLEDERRQDTIWSNVYDLRSRKLCLKRSNDYSKAVMIDLDQLDFSPQSRSQMLNIKEGDTGLRPYSEEANRRLISGFFNHPVISQIMKLPDRDAMIDFIADQAKSYDTVNEIVLRFLEKERIKGLPVKETHKFYVLKYLASKFETGKDYTEAQVNAVIDEWHTFGDYFILRRELIDSGLLKRLPNGSKYWRERL